jgi:hypothetical protein
LLLLFAFLAAGGCGHMPVTSMVKLAAVDLQTTDPEQLRVAVKLPNALRARAEGTVLRIGVRLSNGVEDVRDFALRELTEPTERDALRRDASAGSRISAYALTAADVANLHTFRGALIRKQTGSGGAITISVRPDACRAEPLPNGPVLFTTYLRTAETGGYVTLARNVDLRRLDKNRDIAATIPACG